MFVETFIAIFKMVSFFKYCVFFRAVFCIEYLECACGFIFETFLAIVFFDSK